jgi:aspartyl protease/PDZ domain-containing protein
MFSTVPGTTTPASSVDPMKPIRSVYQICAIVLAAILVLAASPRPAPGARPTGLDLFLRHYRAMGGLDRIRKEASVYLQGTIVMDNMAGRFQQWQGRVLRYRRFEDFSILRQHFGDDGAMAWQVDTNGKRIIDRDPEALKRRTLQALLDSFMHLEPGSPYFSLVYQGEEKVVDAPCHAVRMTNRINTDTTVYYFRCNDFFLVKTVQTRPDLSLHTHYADHRRVNGILRPFRQETTILPREKREIIQIENFLPGVDIDPWLFSPPPDDAEDFKFESGGIAESIPFEFIDNHIFVPVTIGNQTGRWLLDSGASMSVIDAGAAAGLGLAPRGEIHGFGNAERFSLSFVKLPAFQVGGVRFDPQTAYAFQGLARQFDDMAVSGILGYDFLSRFVSRIDYSGKTLTVFRPGRFVYNGPGTTIDAPLKNRMFVVPITIDGRYSGRWTIDLGAFDMSFHYPFAHARGLIRRPGVDRLSAGLGGEFTERTVMFQTAQLGGWTVTHPLINIPYEKGRGSHAGAEDTGNAGNALLRHFVIYLDYRHQRVIVEKGRDFNRRFPRDQSGLQITEDDHALARIVFVAPGTPAAAAGLAAGDRIESVADGSGVQGAADLRRRLFGPAGTQVGLTVRRGQHRFRLWLTLADLFDPLSKERDVGP